MIVTFELQRALTPEQYEILKELFNQSKSVVLGYDEDSDTIVIDLIEDE